MAPNAPTIIDLKTAFLRSQILALSQPLRPSAAFTASFTSDEENTLRQKAIDEALHKLNTLLKQHNKLAYGPQAQRHVGEQVDKLYWNAGERGVNTLGLGDEWAERGADYRQDEVIEQLPEQWSQEAATKAPEQAAKYTELQERLKTLNEKRRLGREKLERYKHMHGLVDLLGEDAGVQENLVVKNGEMEVELERMRRLMLRVERGMGALNERAGEMEDMELDDGVLGGEGEDAKILALLGAG